MYGRIKHGYKDRHGHTIFFKNEPQVVNTKWEGAHTRLWQLAVLHFQAWKEFALVISLKVFCTSAPAHNGKENVTQLHLYFSPLVNNRGLWKLPDRKTAASFQSHSRFHTLLLDCADVLFLLCRNIQ